MQNIENVPDILKKGIVRDLGNYSSINLNSILGVKMKQIWEKGGGKRITKQLEIKF